MHDQPPLSDSEQPRAGMGRWLGLGLALVVAMAVLARTHSIGLMGFDSYPLILTARIESWADFLGTFSEELMDGRYSGQYFRPLLNLSFALDHALWGLDAFGYQLTGALLFGACGWALWLALGRLLGEQSWVGLVAGLMFFFLHDSHFEVIPVPARRPELLCGLFACLALASQLKPSALAKRWSWAPAAWMLLAAASKETGYALPAVCVVAVLLYSPLPSFKQRALHALRAGLVHAVLIGALLALRLAMLGGLGGPAPLPEGFVGPAPLELSRALVLRLLLPQNVESWGALVPWLAGLAGLAVVGSWFLAGHSSREAQTTPAPARRALLVALAWLALVTLLYGISRSIEQWYLFLPVIGLSLLFGATAQLLWSALRNGPTLQRGFAGLGAVCLAGFAFCQVRYTPLLHAYPEWPAATSASDEFFTRLGNRIERVPAGSPLKAPPIPLWYPPAPSGPAIRGAAILEDYSVQAWVELKHPDRTFRVLKGPPATPLQAGESVIQLLRPFEFQVVVPGTRQ